MQIIDYLAVIPARGNSKRIKNKNLVKFNNKTLVQNTLDQVSDLKNIGLIALSSDSKKILDIGKNYKRCISISRPKKISNSSSSTEDAITHAINVIEKKNYKIKNIVLLQVTSPLRSKKDIHKCIKIFEVKKLSSIFSCYKKKIFAWKKEKESLVSFTYNYKKRKMSQKMENYYLENGAIYIFDAKKFKKIKNRIIKPYDIYLMSEKNSIDIDTKEDLKLLDFLKS